MQYSEQRRRLYRSCDYKVIAGVCAGLADFFGLSTLLVRIMFIIGCFLSAGGMLFVYLLLWILMPKQCRRLSSRCGCYGECHEHT